MTGTEQEPAYKTFSFRVNDATSGKYLVALANATHTVWNDCNEVSERSTRRGPTWATKQQLRNLTKGASRELGLPSQVIQEIIDEFLTKRRKAGRPKPPGADDPCQDRQPEKGCSSPVLPSGGQPRGRRLCRHHLIPLADRIGRREGDTRCELVEAAHLP